MSTSFVDPTFGWSCACVLGRGDCFNSPVADGTEIVDGRKEGLKATPESNSVFPCRRGRCA